MASSQPPGGKRSYVWDYFVSAPPDSSDPSQPKRKCKKCAYTCKPKGGSTASMQYHLSTKHGVTKESHEQQEHDSDVQMVSDNPKSISKVSKLVKQPSMDSYCASNRFTTERWYTDMVVLDGWSANSITNSNFVKASCTAMRLRHFKSHNSVQKGVLDCIDGMRMEAKKDIEVMLKSEERFSVMADEWTSVRNRRYMNVTVKTSRITENLGLVRCRGSVTAKVVSDMVKVSVSPILLESCY